MADFRKITRSTPAREELDTMSAIIFNLEPGQVVEVLSEDHPVYFRASHLAQPVYIAREDTVEALAEEVALVQPGPSGAAPAFAAAPEPAAAPVASGYCPHCGASIDYGMRFCRECGGSLVAATAGAGELAPISQRLGALVLDTLLVWFASIFLGIFFYRSDVGGEVAGWLVFLSAAGYYVVGYSLGGTLGALAVGLRIETEAGEQPGYWRGLVRWFMSILSFLAFGLGYLCATWDPKKRTWHDMAAGTLVVKR
jgi:uncharacterized RDD family membrane protein YckC